MQTLFIYLAFFLVGSLAILGFGLLAWVFTDAARERWERNHPQEGKQSGARSSQWTVTYQ